NLSTRLIRRYCTGVIKEQLKVQTFCDIHVNVPYNVVIKPLDVHKHHDKLDIELVGVDNARRSVKHVQDGNSIKIFAGNQNFDHSITCNIKVPIKASQFYEPCHRIAKFKIIFTDLNITTQGNISTGFFNGSKLILQSTKGSIFVDKYQGDQIELSTETGNIVLKGAVVAADIKAKVSENGSIRTKRLQGLSAHLSTNQGNISVDASYCDSSTFETKSGILDLQNIHKSNKIIVGKGNLNLNGLDGELEAELLDACADIQISRVLGDSKIVVEDGDLILRLSEGCQEDTMFEIVSKSHVLDQTVKSIPSKSDGTLYLTPTAEQHKQVFVKCGGSVRIQSASWMNMLKLNVKK
ncbi:protein FAM185A, partial [Asbolus verrucosus]